MTTYRAPSVAALMVGMLLSAEAIAATVAASHETMRPDVERLITAQDKARRLMVGDGDFATLWRVDAAPEDGGPVDVMAGAIASMLAYVSPMDAPPAEAVHRFVMRIAEADVSHPFVQHRAVLRDACRALGQPAPDWSDIDALVLFGAGPSVGQACVFTASDESVHEGTVSHVWGPEMVNLDFDDGGTMRTASSVRVVRQAAAGDRYVCVLR